MTKRPSGRNGIAIALTLSCLVALTAFGQDLMDNGNGGAIRLTDCQIEYIKAPGIYAAESGRLIRAPKELSLIHI